MKRILPRIETIDLFRGYTLILMILVNNPGDWGAIYTPLKHASWNGLTIADLVFPFFLFIMGVTIPILNEKKLSILEITKRSLILIFLGLVLNLIPKFDFNTIRIPGVLQRIGLVYFFSCLIFKFQKKILVLFIIFITLLILHSYLIYIPINGSEKVELKPNKNFSNYLDNLILKNHLWEFSKTWDPEGILGTISSISSCLAGIIFGLFVFHSKNMIQILLLFFLFLVLILPFNNILPINKSLWTASYVILTSGIGILFYLILNFLKSFDFEFVKLFGKNSLFLFFYTSLLAKLLNLKIFENGKLGLKSLLFVNILKNHFEIYFASFLWSIFILVFFYFVLKFRKFLTNLT